MCIYIFWWVVSLLLLLNHDYIYMLFGVFMEPKSLTQAQQIWRCTALTILPNHFEHFTNTLALPFLVCFRVFNFFVISVPLTKCHDALSSFTSSFAGWITFICMCLGRLSKSIHRHNLNLTHQQKKKTQPKSSEWKKWKVCNVYSHTHT